MERIRAALLAIDDVQGGPAPAVAQLPGAAYRSGTADGQEGTEAHMLLLSVVFPHYAQRVRTDLIQIGSPVRQFPFEGVYRLLRCDRQGLSSRPLSLLCGLYRAAGRLRKCREKTPDWMQ